MIRFENSIQFVDQDNNKFNIIKTEEKVAKIYVMRMVKQ